MSQLMDGLSNVGQILGGLMVLMPFVLRDRSKEGMWFFDLQRKNASPPAPFQPAIFAVLLIAALSSISAFVVGETVVGRLIPSLDLLFATRLAVSTSRTSR